MEKVKSPNSDCYDYLTGLLNRAGFLEAAEEKKENLLERGVSFAMLFLNLDSLKFFNHKFGYQEGNRLLQSVGRLLVRIFPDGVCSRLGQDHFAVITEDADLEEKLNRLFQECKKINEGKNLPVRVGIFLFRDKSTEIVTACDRAKLACDTLRNTYVSGFCYYDSDLEKITKRNQYVIENLDQALEKGWIKVFYQPIVRSANGKVCEEEALARWDDPEYGLLPPSGFIPALEEAGLVYKLDLYVLEQVLEKIRLIKAHGITPVAQSINLSRADFDSCNIVEEIRVRVDESGIERSMLKIELTESMIGRDFAFMKEQIKSFRELGFEVWMDDFGSGYSTLNLLQSIEVDLIKFDMRLTQSFEAGSRGKIILTELMKLAIGLGIDTICEGVETEEEVRFLREIGCEKLQGFFYFHPVPAEHIIKRCEEGKNTGVEDPAEADYYDTIGRINLYDLAIAVNQELGGAHQYFNMVPIAIMEITGEMVHVVRTNQTYREFAMQTVGHDLSGPDVSFSSTDKDYEDAFLKMIVQCSREKNRSFISQKMPNKTVVHSVIRWIADNPHTGASAVAVVILAAVDAEQETTYENIARTLASDYFKLYYVDLETEKFIEYSSDIGQEDLAIERHGEAFFNSVRKDAKARIYEEDIENFIFAFTRQNVERALKEQGTFTMTYRQMIQGKPVHVNMKALQMKTDAHQLVIGISRVEEQAKLEEGYERSVFSNAISGTEAERLGSASLNTVSFVMKSCVRLMETGDFKKHVRQVLADIKEMAQADSVRILLLDSKKEETILFADVFTRKNIPPIRKKVVKLPFKMVAGWEKLMVEENAITIEKKADFEYYEQKDPEWIASLHMAGIKSLVLVPLRRADHTLGYLYVTNYNTAKTEKIREMLELVSFFIGSEIENYLVRRELEILSTYDELTGLKNRYAMLNRVRTMEQEEPEKQFAILTMDLNGLKRLNDTEGHFAGDAMIIRTANFLRQSLGEEDLYRIGGDEFIKVFPGIDKEEFEKISDRFREKDLPESGLSLAIGPWWSECCKDADKAFYQADQAMYADKRAFYEKHPELDNRKH